MSCAVIKVSTSAHLLLHLIKSILVVKVVVLSILRHILLVHTVTLVMVVHSIATTLWLPKLVLVVVPSVHGLVAIVGVLGVVTVSRVTSAP